jgi:predicted nuclease of restriction endonuclease-like (RecB) superfamily
LYWQIGRLIVEDEQRGVERAEYGKAVLADLSKRLTAEFGKGHDASNLRHMRLVYQVFPIRDALRHELGWTHYRMLTRVKDAATREWYMHEAATQNWSSRALDRQISVLYYERLPGAKTGGESVRQEGAILTAPLADSPLDFLRYSYVFEFLGLQSAPHLHERDLESELLTHLQSFLLELGKGFAFVARQQRLTVGRTDFYVDLVFYN